MSYCWECILACVHERADQLAIIEMLGEVRLGMLLYIDDNTTPCASVQMLREVVHPDYDFAFRRVSIATESKFNYSKGKPCAMPVFDAPVPAPSDVGCEIVQSHSLLGVNLDRKLTFAPLLAGLTARGRILFDDYLQVCVSLGLHLPIAALQVPMRVEPVVLFAAPLAIVAENSVRELNKLQRYWACRLLTSCRFARIPDGCLLYQCGWPLRLSSHVIEIALVARARAELLPPTHPTRLVLSYAMANVAPSWPQKLETLLRQYHLQSILTVTACGLFPDTAIAQAERSNEDRKTVLRRYKWENIRPKLLEHDRVFFQEQLSKSIDAFGVPFRQLCPQPFRFQTGMLELTYSDVTWLHFRVWAIVPMTGKLPRLRKQELVLHDTDTHCAFCTIPKADVVHYLCRCQGQHSVYDHHSDIQWARPCVFYSRRKRIC